MLKFDNKSLEINFEKLHNYKNLMILDSNLVLGRYRWWPKRQRVSEAAMGCFLLMTGDLFC